MPSRPKLWHSQVGNFKMMMMLTEGIQICVSLCNGFQGCPQYMSVDHKLGRAAAARL
jgi:hypothetical protein